MKFVDNLLEVRPEEIEHIEFKTPIQTVVKVANPPAPHYAVIVVWSDGSMDSYTVDGRYVSTEGQLFIYKKRKVKRLKPLHQILTEFPDYLITSGGAIHLRQLDGYILYSSMLEYLGGICGRDYYSWDERLFEEVEE